MRQAHDWFERHRSLLACRFQTRIAFFALVGGLLSGAVVWGQSTQWQQGSVAGSIYYNGNVGIGTSTPGAPLDVSTAFYTGQGLLVIRPQDGNVEGGEIALMGAGSNNGLRLDNYMGHARIYWVDSVDHQLQVFNAGGGTTGMYVEGNVGIGTTTPQYKLAVNGNIGAQDIIVTNTGWSDYVFKPGYRLLPLSEVDQFIQANGHLPDIPTEAEVTNNGVSVGDMQAKLLAKVEELTLHLIQQDRELREQLTQQEKENRELRERLVRVEKAAAVQSPIAASDGGVQ